MLVIEGSQVIDVGLELLLVEEPGAENQAQQIVLARLDRAAQLALREGFVAGKIDRGNLDARPLLDVDNSRREIVLARYQLEVDFRVQVTLLLINLGDVARGGFGPNRVVDGSGVNRERIDDRLVA